MVAVGALGFGLAFVFGLGSARPFVVVAGRGGVRVSGPL